MIIDLNELRQSSDPLSLSINFDTRQLKLPSDVNLSKGPVRSQLTVSLAGDQVKVMGELKAELELDCCRCLKSFGQSLKKNFRLEYWPDPEVKQEAERAVLNYKDLVVGFYHNDQLDLSAIVCEQIVLEIPMKLVCEKDCKGLCDQCGVDLNENECSCERRTIDPRLVALSSIKERLNK